MYLKYTFFFFQIAIQRSRIAYNPGLDHQDIIPDSTDSMTWRKLHWLRFAKLTREIKYESHAHLLKLQSYFLDFALEIVTLIN